LVSGNAFRLWHCGCPVTDAEIIIAFEMRRQGARLIEVAQAMCITQAALAGAMADYGRNPAGSAARVPPAMTPDLIRHEAAELLAQVRGVLERDAE